MNIQGTDTDTEDHETWLNKLTIKRGNNLEIIPSSLHMEAITSAYKASLINNKNNAHVNGPVHAERLKTIVYDPHTLRQIGLKCKHDNQLKTLPFSTIRRVRELRINFKRIRTKPNPEHNNTKPQQTKPT